MENGVWFENSWLPAGLWPFRNCEGNIIPLITQPQVPVGTGIEMGLGYGRRFPYTLRHWSHPSAVRNIILPDQDVPMGGLL